MVENGIRQTNKVELSPEEGLHYAQWGLMRLYVGADCFYVEWKQEANPKVRKNVFWLEQPGKNDHISPVYGVIEKEESISDP